MNARQDGRQGHWYDPTALAETENLSEPRPTCVYRSTRATFDNTTRTARRPRVSSSLLRGVRYAILFELVGAALVIGAWVLVGFFANHLSNLTIVLGIIGVGVLFRAMLAVKA